LDKPSQKLVPVTLTRPSAAWERNGFIVWYKRLEKQRFRWPSVNETLHLTGQELNWLLDGFDIFNNQPHSPLNFSSVT